jgi:hypothetical protein
VTLAEGRLKPIFANDRNGRERSFERSKLWLLL